MKIWNDGVTPLKAPNKEKLKLFEMVGTHKGRTQQRKLGGDN